MSWIPNFLRPSMAWLFALLIPVIIFYFLKLRRTRLEISSLALWRQVINDQRVNSPFQKFKRNLLLLLQIILLSLLALAAMQPYWGGNAERLSYLPILIDCSASMGAKDAEGKTRLDVVKEQVNEIIEGMLPGQQVTLVAMGATTRRVTGFTDNKPLLREALSALRVDDAPNKVADGLRLAQALSRTYDIERVRLYSDGNLPVKQNPTTGLPMAEIDFDVTFSVDFFQIDPGQHNIGITAFNARRSSAENWDVFVRVEASHDASAEGEIRLSANGELLGEQDVVLGKGESQRLVFRVPADIKQSLKVQLQPQSEDSLAADNVAFLNLPRGRDIVVYCPKEFITFRHALRASSGVQLEPADDGTSKTDLYDLVISDQQGDIALEAPVSMFIGFVPPELSDMIMVREEGAEVVDWQREAQLLQHVQLKEVIISEQPAKTGDVQDDDIERLGYQILAYGNRGPLILRKRSGVQVHYYCLFHTDQSTLPYRVGFPVLCNNLISEAMQLASLNELRAPATGVLPVFEFANVQQVRVTSPDGKHDERHTNDDGQLIGVSAPIVGEYEIRSGGTLLEKVGVGLLDPQETSLVAVDRLYFNELSVDAETAEVVTDQPLWPRFAALAFAVLLFEWWYFQKKPTGMPD